MRHSLVFSLAMGLLVGLLGLPASASINQVGTLAGNAEVGKTFLTANDCDKSGDAKVVGRGLYLPGTPDDATRENQGAWHLEVALNSPTKLNPTLEVCGWLGPLDGTRNYNPPDPNRVDGIGPSCGASKGHHGMGEIRQNNVPTAKLLHLGWKAEGMLIGSYQEYIGGNPGNKGKKGTFIAQLVMQGGFPCLGSAAGSPNGAQTFDVAGTYELINADTKDVQAPKIQHKKCKETDPNDNKTKEQDAGSDPDWKRTCPTAKK